MLITVLWILYFGLWAVNLYLLIKDIRLERPVMCFLAGWGLVITIALLVMDFRTVTFVLLGQILAGIAVGFNKQLK